VTDGGHPPLSSSATLRLIVEGRNDERPHFEHPAYYFNVSESSLPGTLVGRVVAVDADASPRFARVVYRIRRQTGTSIGTGTGNDGGGAAFEVDSASGEVRTVRRLDRERRSVYVFTVVASNDVEYHPTVTSRRPEVDVADVTVYVDDVNDNEPVFVFPGGERGDIAYFSSSLLNRVSHLLVFGVRQ